MIEFHFAKHNHPVADFMVAIGLVKLNTKYDLAPMYEFQFGTTSGLFQYVDNAIVLVAIINSHPGNGHVQLLFQRFETMGRDNNKERFEIIEIHNKAWEAKLLKRGFTLFEKGIYKNIESC